MNHKTVNTKGLSQLQKNIIKIMDREIKDSFWGIPVTTLSWIVAKETQTQRDKNYIPRNRRIQLIQQKAMKREIEIGIAPFLMSRVKTDKLTNSFRSSFSRSLKRLEERGIIKRMQLELEKCGDKNFWVQYVNVKRAHRVTFKEKQVSALEIEPLTQ